MLPPSSQPGMRLSPRREGDLSYLWVPDTTPSSPVLIARGRVLGEAQSLVIPHEPLQRLGQALPGAPLQDIQGHGGHWSHPFVARGAPWPKRHPPWPAKGEGVSFGAK
jgi:hypothetical protein